MEHQPPGLNSEALFRALFNQAAYLSHLERHAEALQACARALGLKADHAPLWRLKGHLSSKEGRHASALSDFEEALRLKPDDPDSWRAKACCLEDIGRLEEALTAYEHALRLAPRDDRHWRAKGELLSKLGRFEPALLAYEEALLLDRGSVDSWRAKSSALRMLGRPEEAASAHDEAERLTTITFMGVQGAIRAIGGERDAPANRILEERPLRVESSSPVVAFTEGEKKGWRGERYLTIDGRPAYTLTYWCGTCGYFFERAGDAGRVGSIDTLRGRTATGLEAIDDEIVQPYTTLIQSGDYIVVLREIHPRLITPGSPEDYFTTEQMALMDAERYPSGYFPYDPRLPYYRGSRLKGRLRGRSSRVFWSTGLFEFVIPMVPDDRLSTDTVAAYRQSLTRGQRPTAIALSCLDIELPHNQAYNSELQSHWCWGHFLLDGHHKMFAAALEQRPITLLSFVALESGLSSPDDVRRMLAIFRDL